MIDICIFVTFAMTRDYYLSGMIDIFEVIPDFLWSSVLSRMRTVNGQDCYRINVCGNNPRPTNVALAAADCGFDGESI